MIAKALAMIHKDNMRKDPLPEFSIGDSIKIQVRIREGGKERLQAYSGTVIARDGHGATETFTVRRIAHGVGVERIFPLNSPNVAKIEIEGSGERHRAKLYFLRDRAGKSARLREKSKTAQE
jgi:large subunit ribosomal protein L19